MTSRSHRVREQVEQIRTEFTEHGVTDWYMEQTQKNHMRVIFYRGGKMRSFTFSPSGEPHTLRNNRARIRRLIRAD